MLMYICHFVLKNLLMTTEHGDYLMKSFTDEHMERLFEKFILEFYRRHYPKCKAVPKEIEWEFDKAEMSIESEFVLPAMKTDIFLTINSRTLIIDAKYYAHSLISNMGKYRINSPNFYQIYSYVHNYDKEHLGIVDGMLLYAQTQAEGKMDYQYQNKEGNTFYVKSLDLNQDFEVIKQQLVNIIGLYK